jgi:hypothetical protein
MVRGQQTAAGATSSSGAAVGAESSAIGGARARAKAANGLLPPADRPPYQSSLKQGNNSWYAGERGEHKREFSVGRVPPERPLNRSGIDHNDLYTQSRNLANDGNRYSYASDCTNAVQRDFQLRFANPPQAVKAPEVFGILPPLKFVEKVAVANKLRTGGGSGGVPSASGQAREHRATAVQARQGRVSGVEEPKRFTVIPGPQRR